MKDYDAFVRVAAAKALLWIERRPIPEAILALAEALDSEYWRIRRASEDGLSSTFEYQRLLPRPQGLARVLWQIGAFKSGKRLPAAVFLASFGVVPELKWDLVGLTYDTSSPEF